MSLIAERIAHVYSPGSIYETQALQEVSLCLEPGRLVALIGQTGSGKSSLLQILSGLQKPSQGRVLLEDMPLYHPDTDRKRLHRLVGVSFQYPEHQLFEETVAKEIAFGLRKQGLDEAAIEQRIDETLALVGLTSAIRGRSPFELSGGQMRRVALASTLALQPRYLFLDEPIAGLDPRGRDEILACILDYKQRSGAAILFVSHSMEDVATIADRIMVLCRGQLLLEGTPEDVFRQKELLYRSGLELPQAYLLIETLRAAGLELDAGIALDAEQATRMLAAYLRENPGGVCRSDRPAGRREP